MSTDRAAGVLLIGLPIAFNAFFFLLGRSFDYPGILRSPARTILSRFLAGGVQLKLLWYGFMLTAVMFAPLAVLMGQVLARDGLEIVPVATTIGVLAGGTWTQPTTAEIGISLAVMAITALGAVKLARPAWSSRVLAAEPR